MFKDCLTVMRNSKSRERVKEKGILRDETADRPQKKKRLTKRKRKKLRAISKKNTMMVGLFKNGAKSKEMCSTVPALTASNKARLQGDVLKLLNGDSKAINVQKNNLVCLTKRKDLVETSTKEPPAINPSKTDWSPRTCYKTFCAMTMMDFQSKKFVIDNNTVTDYVLKIKTKLRQFYADAFRRQILQQKAENDGLQFDVNTLGLINALDASRNINIENMEIPACSYSANSELLLKPMNNIRLDSKQASKESQQNDGKAVHIPKNSLVEAANAKMANPKKTAKISMDLGKEMIMKRFFKSIKQASKQLSYEDNKLPDEHTKMECHVLREKFVHDSYEKKSKNAELFRQYGACYKNKLQYDLGLMVDRPERDLSSALFSKGNKNSSADVNFQGLDNESLVTANVGSNYFSDNKHCTYMQTPLLYSHPQFFNTRGNNQLHSVTSGVCEDDSVRNVLMWGKSQIIKSSKRNDLRVNGQNNEEVFFLESPCSESQKANTAYSMRIHDERREKNMLKTKHSVETATLATSSPYDTNQSMFFEHFDINNNNAKHTDFQNSLVKGPIVTPRPSWHPTNSSNCTTLLNSEFLQDKCLYKKSAEISSMVLNNNVTPLVVPRHSLATHGKKNQSHVLFHSKDFTSRNKNNFEHHVQSDCAEKLPYIEFQRDNLRETQKNTIHKQQGKKISRQKHIQHSLRDKNLESSYPLTQMPVFINDIQQNDIYSGMTQGIIQPTKYLAVAESDNTQKRVPLYLRIADQNILTELAHRPIEIVKYNERRSIPPTNMVIVSGDEVNGKIGVIPTMPSHQLLSAYNNTSMQNRRHEKSVAKLVPVNIQQAWQPQIDSQTRILSQNMGVGMPNYYILQNTVNENPMYMQSHYNC